MHHARWVAQELTRKDPALVMFCPFLFDYKDYSGRSRHIGMGIGSGFGGYTTGGAPRIPKVGRRGGHVGLSPGGRFSGVNNWEALHPFLTTRYLTFSVWVLFNETQTSNTAFYFGGYDAAGSITGIFTTFETSNDWGRVWYYSYNENITAGVSVFSEKVIKHKQYNHIVVILPNIYSWTFDDSLIPTQFTGSNKYKTKIYVNGTECTDYDYSTNYMNMTNIFEKTGSVDKITVDSGMFFHGSDSNYDNQPKTLALFRGYQRELYAREIKDLYERERDEVIFAKPRKFSIVPPPPSWQPLTSSLDLIISSATSTNSNVNLITQGANSTATSSIDLILASAQNQTGTVDFVAWNNPFNKNNSFDMTLEGDQVGSGFVNLFTRGFDKTNQDAHLVTFGAGISKNQLNLFLPSPNLSFGYNLVDMTLTGGSQDGLFTAAPMTITGEKSGINNSLNLVLSSPNEGDTQKSLNMVMVGQLPKVDGVVPMSVNSGQKLAGAVMSMFIRGDGGLPNSLPFNNSLNLLLERNPGEKVDFVLTGHDTAITTSAPMVIEGTNYLSSGVELSIPATFETVTSKVRIILSGA